jgi:alpha-tubulin suppressor-like RCC1 family protein
MHSVALTGEGQVLFWAASSCATVVPITGARLLACSSLQSYFIASAARNENDGKERDELLRWDGKTLLSVGFVDEHVLQLVAGADFLLLVGQSGAVYSVGESSEKDADLKDSTNSSNFGRGQLGRGGPTNALLPVEAGENVAFVSVAAGPQHALAVDATGRLFAW